MFLCQKYLTLISRHANPKQIPLIQFGGLLDRIIQLLQFYVLSNSHFEYKNYLSLIALFLHKLYEHFFLRTSNNFLYYAKFAQNQKSEAEKSRPLGSR